MASNDDENSRLIDDGNSLLIKRLTLSPEDKTARRMVLSKIVTPKSDTNTDIWSSITSWWNPPAKPPTHTHEVRVWGAILYWWCPKHNKMRYKLQFVDNQVEDGFRSIHELTLLNRNTPQDRVIFAGFLNSSSHYVNLTWNPDENIVVCVTKCDDEGQHKKYFHVAGTRR